MKHCLPSNLETIAGHYTHMAPVANGGQEESDPLCLTPGDSFEGTTYDTLPQHTYSIYMYVYLYDHWKRHFFMLQGQNLMKTLMTRPRTCKL